MKKNLVLLSFIFIFSVKANALTSENMYYEKNTNIFEKEIKDIQFISDVIKDDDKITIAGSNDNVKINKKKVIDGAIIITIEGLKKGNTNEEITIKGKKYSVNINVKSVINTKLKNNYNLDDRYESDVMKLLYKYEIKSMKEVDALTEIKNNYFFDELEDLKKQYYPKEKLVGEKQTRGTWDKYSAAAGDMMKSKKLKRVVKYY